MEGTRKLSRVEYGLGCRLALVIENLTAACAALKLGLWMDQGH